METSITSASWQRAGHYPGFDQDLGGSQQFERDLNTDMYEGRASPRFANQGQAGAMDYEMRPAYGGQMGGREEFSYDRARGDEYTSYSQYPPSSERFSAPHHFPQQYHPHEEEQTDFRGSFEEDFSLPPQHFDKNGNTAIGHSIPQDTSGYTVYPPRYHDYHDYVPSNTQERPVESPHDPKSGSFWSDEHMYHTYLESKRDIDVAPPDMRNAAHGLYNWNSSGDKTDEEGGFDEKGGHHENYQAWHRDHHHEHSDEDETDWKRPDMHMFKASSCKGSVTSEKSSRLDPHTYQSYAAGLLLSSGRGEKFLKLQERFAILERIGELDKSNHQDAAWQGFAQHGHAFHSQEEVQDLHAELEEARKKKEFFHETDKKGKVHWTPEKDYGLKKRENSLKDHVRTYSKLMEDASLKSPTSSTVKQEQIQRAVSFGALYEKFSTSGKSDTVSTKSNPKNMDNNGKTASGNTWPTKSSTVNRTEGPKSVSAKQSESGPTSLSYLQLMDNAAKMSRQRAIHGTHMNPRLSEFETYVEEMKKKNKEEPDSMPVHVSSQKYSFLEASHVSPSCNQREKSFPRDSVQVRGVNRQVSPEIVLDSSSTSKPSLKGKFGQDNEKDTSYLSSSTKPSIQHDMKQDSLISCKPRIDTDAHSKQMDSAVSTSIKSWPVRPKYSDMPDIVQIENQHDHSQGTPSNPRPYSATFPMQSKYSPKEAPHFPPQTHTNPAEVGTTRHFPQDKSVGGKPEEANTAQHGVKRPGVSEVSAVFHVKNLRNLAENNEFSINHLSWMKKPNTGHTDKVLKYETRDHKTFTPQPPISVVKEKSMGINPVKPVSSNYETNSSYNRQQEKQPLVQQSPLTSQQFINTFRPSSSLVPVPKKISFTAPKPESLSFAPLPSQSGPTFSNAKRPAELRYTPVDNSKHTDSLSVNMLPHKPPPDLREQHNTGLTEMAERYRGIKRSGIAFVNMPQQIQEGAYAAAYIPRSEDRDTGPERQSDSNDPHSEHLDKQYGQLRKWTAVADIYRNVEKSWSPTREARPFRPENNSSISSTDTFIVKDTDEEDIGDDLGSSAGSVSQLRQIFERQQKMSKSRSEPDVFVDSQREPTRPRSAKSQADLSSFNSELAHPTPRIPRTVSGDLSEIRHRYNDGAHQDDRQNPEFDTTSQSAESYPTDAALRAWVQYTNRGKYDPYLPPEDILKEVSSASIGRKLDVPKPKNYRPSNVSRMTLEYLDQIGSEWQQSNTRGYIAPRPGPVKADQQSSVPETGVVTDTQPIQPNGQRLDRRYLSHHYVNEEPTASTHYSQTDDVKLKQSQMAGNAGFPTAPEHSLGVQSFPSDNSMVHSNPNTRADYSAPIERTGPSLTRTLSGLSRSLPVKARTQQFEPKLSEAPGSEPAVTKSAHSVSRQPVSHVPYSSHTAPTPVQRSRPPLSQALYTAPRSQLFFSNSQPSSDLPSQNLTLANTTPYSSGYFTQRETDDAEPEKTSPEEESVKFVPPEPARLPPLSPLLPRTPKAQPRGVQHMYSKSSDSEHSSGDFGAVYCVSTGSVLYGAEAEEEPPVPPPPPPHTLINSSATFPRKHTPRQTQGSGNPGGLGSNPAPKNPAPFSATLGRNGSAPEPPARGGSADRGIRGASTLPLPWGKPYTPRTSSLSAVEKLGLKSPPPASTSPSFVSRGSGATKPATGSASSTTNPSPSAAFKHQTSDVRRPRPEPVNPEKDRRRKEEEEAYRKKRLEELYEEERMKKIKKDEADAEARRHHDYFVNSQKSPISPNRFDDATNSLSPSMPGSLGTLERKDPQLSVPPERRRGFQIQGKARALFNFTAQNPREMSFRKNDIIYLLRQVDKNWFEGERHGMVGIFPSNYVEVVTSIEAAQAAAMQAEGQGRAKYNFTAQSSVELSIRKGEFVVLLRRVDENWYEGRIGNRQGIFPVSYVEITREPSTPLITPAPSVITTPMTGTPEMLSPVGYDAAPTPPPQPSPSAFSSLRHPYGYSQPPHHGYPSSAGSSSSSLLTPATSVSRQQINLNRQDQDFSSQRSAKSPIKSPISPVGRLGSPGRKASPSPGVGSKLSVDIHSSAKPFANGQPASSAPKVKDDDLALTRYRALYAYRPQNEDELELMEGDEVFVMEKCDDGWFVGTSARTGCFGTFPGNYVQKF